ncbi:TniQ family protein [Pseudomonas sp. NPDC098747]|uniref:TniQ family protein n=1 Tax=Pseudomonas sp. NPDC098747 TaxID=3364487 RepID=UPI00383B4CB2
MQRTQKNNLYEFKKMHKLVFIPVPHPQESGISLLIRCATANGYETLKFFSSVFRLKLKNIANSYWNSSEAHNLLTQHKMLHPAEKELLEEAFHSKLRRGSQTHININGVSFPASLLRQQLVLCSACIRSGHLNIMHTLKFSDVCPIHAEQYITSCPHCSQPLDWLLLRNYYCRCGFDLRKSPSRPSDKTASAIIKKAMIDRDGDFFRLLLASMTAFRYLHTSDGGFDFMKTCVKIATGKKDVFFHEMQTLRQYFPSLHLRALMAPFILSSDTTLSKFGIEYFYNSLKSKPTNHEQDCRCSELLFTEPELIYIFNSLANVTQLKAERLCFRTDFKSYPSVRRPLYKCPNICNTLINQGDCAWDSTDAYPSPESNFELLDHKKAAALLHTSPRNVKYLISAGLLKGFKPKYIQPPKTTILSIKDFNEKYMLRSEIASRSGLRDTELKKLIDSFIPTVIHTTLYANKIRIYLRNQVPPELTCTIDKQAAALIQPPLSAQSLLSFKKTAELLSISRTDTSALIDAGIIRTKKVTTRDKTKGRQFCTGESVLEAIAWRKKHLSVVEVSAKANCSPHLIRIRFINSGFITPLALRHTAMISLADVNKLVNHIKKYTTLQTLATEFMRNASAIVKIIEQGGILPLTRDHPDFIKGQVTLLRTETQKVMKQYAGKKHGATLTDEQKY